MPLKLNAKPKVVSKEEWQAARDVLLIKEKEATRARDKLNAERRNLPMYKIEQQYELTGSKGKVKLIDLFEGRNQLALYHFMFDPSWEQGCSGCSMVVDNMCHPAHLAARGISLALVSLAPMSKITAFKERMGWNIPWYSSYETSFNQDFGVTTDKGEVFGLSMLLADGDEIFQTYFTNGRGVEYIGTSFSFYDISPFGRQEDWETSPQSWPQGPKYEWWKHHDSYDGAISKIGTPQLMG